MSCRLATIVSDALAGAARGALEAAVELDLAYGGWVAAGDVPAIYAERTRQTVSPRMAARLNVQDSDGTLLVSFASGLAAGSPAAYADEAADHQRKASLHIVLPAGERSTIPEELRQEVLEWIAVAGVDTLHVTGPREAEAPGIQQAVRDAIVWIFEGELRPRATFSGVDRAATPRSMDLADPADAEHFEVHAKSNANGLCPECGGLPTDPPLAWGACGTCGRPGAS